MDINFTNRHINFILCEANWKKCGTFNGLTSCELKDMPYTWNLFFSIFEHMQGLSSPSSLMAVVQLIFGGL
jgi:hypothetical protein